MSRKAIMISPEPTKVQLVLIEKGPIKFRRPDPDYTMLDKLATGALKHKVKHYAVRLHGGWRIYGLDHHEPILRDLPRDAAETWLSYRSGRF